MVLASSWLDVRSASAQGNVQFLGAPSKRVVPTSPTMKQLSKRDPTAQMLVKADEINYDYTNEQVSAVGNVQIHFGGAIIEADRVIYNERTKRLHAEGNVRLTESDGKVIFGTFIDLGDDFRDGFVDSLRLDMPDRTRIAARRAERSEGNITVFHNGVYTACEPCRDDPRRPPLWQIKAVRMIHDQAEKMIYYENMRLELFGLPFAWLPYMSAPDPTVVRKSGFLMPLITTKNTYGWAYTQPYYWAISPSYDMTITPTVTSRQGVLLDAEWRQRLLDGSYTIRAAGIYQFDKNAFLDTEGPSGFNSGVRDFRGAVQTRGQFNINDQWVWGWNGTLVTDKPFLQDYSIAKITPEIVSSAYIAGRGDRSYFDARAIEYLGLVASDVQSQLPIVHPVVDYFYTYGQPVFGGELSYKVNLTSLSRQNADYDPINLAAANSGACATADPALLTKANCLLRGIPGNYTRFSEETNWRRTFIDGFGQVFTPFISVRADAATLNATGQPGVDNFINPGNSSDVRAMPAVGFEYRYPLISVHSWGTQTIEPIAQVIIRPNETSVGKLPNEDSQSLIFSDANLFSLNKFSGWDRVEGGSRANVGLQYSAHFLQGGFVNMLVGQSYQLFGRNSYAIPDSANSGLDSGLETARSDYVASFMFQPSAAYTLTSRFRFDEQTFAVHRMEFEGRMNFERWALSLLYGNYDAQPDIGFLTRRQGLNTSGTFKLDQNWNVSGSVLYDLEASRVNASTVGMGYIDDCFGVTLAYTTNYGYTVNSQVQHAVMLQISLRTLGSARVSQLVDGFGSSTGSASPFGLH